MLRLLRIAVLASTFGLFGPDVAVAQVAPGRIVLDFGGGRVIGSVDLFGPSVGVARPDGGVVLAGPDRGHGVRLIALRADGSLDAGFGTGGIARVAVPHERGAIEAFPLQLLRRPDGRLVLVYPDAPADPRQAQPLMLAGLTSQGRLDPSFGESGLADTGLGASCGSCSPSALAGDGSIVVTGQTGRFNPRPDGSQPDLRWSVTRLDSAGRVDASFGDGGRVTLATGSAGGSATAVLPDGAIAVLGRDAAGPKLARLTPAGRTDAAFAGGKLVTPAVTGTWTFGLVGQPDGGVVVAATGGGRVSLERRTATGALDPAYGDGGTVHAPGGESPDTLLPLPDGGVIVAGPNTLNPGARQPLALQATRLTGDGRVTRSAAVELPFGGGYATMFARLRAPGSGPLEQNSFRPGNPVVRGDGSLVIPGSVGVIRYTGEGEGVERELGAVAALTPEFALDPSFGGAARRPSLRIRVPLQHARADRRLLRIAVEATASAPGLAQLRVSARRTVVAHSIAPVFTAGRQRLSAFLTLEGRRHVHPARGMRVTVRASFRDLLGQRAAATARGVLR